MPLVHIRAIHEVDLFVNVPDEQLAKVWAGRIRVTLEDDEGVTIPPAHPELEDLVCSERLADRTIEYEDLPYWNEDAFHRQAGICYIAENESVYTYTDFLTLTNGETSVAERLFELCDGQNPATILYDELRDEGMHLPLLYRHTASNTRWLCFHEEEPAPDTSMTALLTASGWQEQSTRRWTHQDQDAIVPVGIAFVETDDEISDELRNTRFQETRGGEA